LKRQRKSTGYREFEVLCEIMLAFRYWSGQIKEKIGHYCKELGLADLRQHIGPLQDPDVGKYSLPVVSLLRRQLGDSGGLSAKIGR